MARTKSPAMRREPSDIHLQHNGVIQRDGYKAEESKDIPSMLEDKLIAHGTVAESHGHDPSSKEAGVLSLLFNVGGIYASFIIWGILQERITTTNHGPPDQPTKFKYPVFLNTIQSTLAALSGLIYLYTSTTHPHKPGRPAPIFPSQRILASLVLVSITTSLASPFGYASLQHIDYITFILAKSCKLLPVMLLQTTIFRKKYPLSKYMVVVAVTLGVAIFTYHNPTTAAKAAKHSAKQQGEKGPNMKLFGLGLLAVNLLFDGLTNAAQDHVFTNFKPYGGPQMMCAMNMISTVLTTLYLLLAPYIGPTSLGATLGMSPTSELSSAIAFIKTYPAVGWDVLGFSLCGALGQVFIYRTLASFSSLVLVTVTVTRKMLTMIISVVYFGHRLTGEQLFGVALVFSGIAGEALMGHWEKKEKSRKAKARMLSEAGQDRKKQSGIEEEKKEL
ncbi:UAA-domain-containing protein [Tothia fuscella]|uniref:UDP-galactose transporter homolog 1 n=1 Tax=Tothia fuscella TaxID=1048955 RepID=A0A9P4TUT1_9PEZI|nr:UAA-domain-containing protein [Tothia fuscella]